MARQLTDAMTAGERRAMSGLSLVYAFRMLGMFMVLPVLATYGQDLTGATPLLIGVAIGAYGLTQAFLQIPFGMLSDRIGRLPVIYAGLLMFALGSAVAAMATSIEIVILGRVLQGAGAISAAVMALLSDLTREQNRSRVMAVIGLSIGLSFVVAMVLGPLLASRFGLSGLFWFTALMALVGILLIAFWVPRPERQVRHLDSGVKPQAFADMLRNPELLRLDVGIFILHALLMASFMVVPLALIEQGALAREAHWWVYLLAMGIGFVAMLPFIIYSEKKRQIKRVFLAAITVLLLSQLYLLLLGKNLPLLIVGLTVFFAAFNLLEATLPSLISKISPAGSKGTAMGVYSTSQFLGAALGGILGGWLFELAGSNAVFLGCVFLAALWLVFAVTMKEPPYVTSTRFEVGQAPDLTGDWLKQLRTESGVMDMLYVAEEAAVYIKFDNKLIDRARLEQILSSPSGQVN